MLGALRIFHNAADALGVFVSLQDVAGECNTVDDTLGRGELERAQKRFVGMETVCRSG